MLKENACLAALHHRFMSHNSGSISIQSKIRTPPIAAFLWQRRTAYISSNSKQQKHVLSAKRYIECHHESEWSPSKRCNDCKPLTHNALAQLIYWHAISVEITSAVYLCECLTLDEGCCQTI